MRLRHSQSRAVIIALTMSMAALLAWEPKAARAVDCGDTVTASITLDHDLVECPGVGLVIGADGVTIELNGHMLDGDGGPDNGIETVTDRAGITIKGPGVIQGFNAGIEVGGAKLKVLGVTFRDLGDAALNVGPCAGSLIAGNTMVDVGQAMDFGAGGGKVTVRDNVIARVQAGIVVGDAVGAAIIGNLVADSLSAGIVVLGPDATVTGNRVTRTVEDGIFLVAVTNGKVVGNTVTRTGEDGIALVDTRTTRVERNLVSDAGGTGILMVDALSDGNRLRRNAVLGSVGHGVFVPAGADATVLDGNVVEGNALDGVRVEQAGTFVRKTRADGNGGVGIRAVAGTTDGGANRGRGNGGPAQCEGVACP